MQCTGSVKIGRYICPCCGESLEEERSFREALKNNLFIIMNVFYKKLRLYTASYQGISAAMQLVFPRGKTTIYNAFMESVEKTYIPPAEYIPIVHYDEHPKTSRRPKFRLTLLDGITGRPIADALYDNKDETTKAFLTEHLDPNRHIFIVTCLAPGYPGILDEVFGDNVIHQLCLLHLNKLIAGKFPRNTTIKQELMKYQLLNIFYNRDAEIKIL